MDNKLKIKGFKCFVEKEIILRRLTVLAGSNSVGKSTVIQSILLLRSAYEKVRSGLNQVQLNGDYLLGLGNTSNIINSKSKEESIRISLTIDDIYTSTRFKVDSITPHTFLEIESPTSKSLLAYGNHPIERSNFHYLHAERLGPRAFYNVSGQHRQVGWQGEFTISLLSSPESDTPEYFVPKEKMFIGSNKPNLISQAQFWMNFIIPGITIDPKQIQEINQSYVQFGGSSPYNVGFGISYVLPIIVAGLIAKKGEMLIVENPEAHLHPSGQSNIGQFLTVVAASGVEVLIETHSEHVINGVRIKSLEGIISPDDVQINFFQKDAKTKEVAIKEVGISETGDLTKFPAGFLDQVQQDLVKMIKLKQEINK